jgi:hypothetical protein
MHAAGLNCFFYVNETAIKQGTPNPKAKTNYGGAPAIPATWEAEVGG